MISPIYSLERERYTDPDFYKKIKNKWSVKAQFEHEKRMKRGLEPVLDQFKRRRYFEKDQMQHALDGKNLQDFDENFQYLMDYIIKDQNYDIAEDFDGLLWMR